LTLSGYGSDGTVTVILQHHNNEREMMSAQIAPQNLTEVQQTSAHISSAIKSDSCKAPLGLIPRSALIEEAHVLAYGAEKYDLHNWRKGMKWTRLIDAVLRHVIAFADGEDFDQESGLHHLAHARASCGFLIEYMESHPELDNRYRRAGQLKLDDPVTERRDPAPAPTSSPAELLTKVWKERGMVAEKCDERPFFNMHHGD